MGVSCLWADCRSTGAPPLPWTPTLAIREGGASSETGYFLPMMLIKCCHASGSRLIDGLYDSSCDRAWGSPACHHLG